MRRQGLITREHDMRLFAGQDELEAALERVWRESAEEFADRGADGFGGSCRGVSQQVFELGKDLFDGVQIGRALVLSKLLTGAVTISKNAGVADRPLRIKPMMQREAPLSPEAQRRPARLIRSAAW
jgi:hypothetical protein